MTPRELWTRARALGQAPTLSPRSLVLWAVRFSALFAFVHLAGFREHTTVLSGTLAGGAPAPISGFFGMVYLFSYFVAVLAVPPLLFAAGVGWVAARLWQKRSAP